MTLLNVSAVAIDGRALAIEGPPGSGKSSLALALIDRGAGLIGDDGVALAFKGSHLIASPPDQIRGMIEIRGIGITTCEVAEPCQLALILTLGETPAERLPDTVEKRTVLGVEVPVLAFAPGHIAPAPRAELALQMHGLPVRTDAN